MAARSVQVEARPFAVDLDPQETAVIVVDMQASSAPEERGTVRAWMSRTHRPPSRRSLECWQRRARSACRSSTRRWTSTGRPRRAPPGYWTEERLSRWVAAGEPRQPMSHAGQLPPGVKESDILPELAPQPDEVIIVKPRFSAFYNTDLDAILKELGVTTLVFTGGTTSICVESTLRDAFFRDYRCLLLADCTAEPIGNRLPRTNREATLLLVELVYGWVAESAALVRTLGEQSVAVHVAQAV